MTIRELVALLEEFDQDMDVKYKNEGVWLSCVYPTIENEDDNEFVSVGI